MSSFHQLTDIPVCNEDIGKLQLLSGAQSMLIFGKMDAGAHIEKHAHPNEQITWLISGRFDYKLSTGEEKSCGPGAIVLIPGGVEHEVWYREDCELVEFFSPPRTDMFPVSADNPYGIE